MRILITITGRKKIMSHLYHAKKEMYQCRMQNPTLFYHIILTSWAVRKDVVDPLMHGL